MPDIAEQKVDLSLDVYPKPEPGTCGVIITPHLRMQGHDDPASEKRPGGADAGPGDLSGSGHRRVSYPAIILYKAAV